MVGAFNDNVSIRFFPTGTPAPKKKKNRDLSVAVKDQPLSEFQKIGYYCCIRAINFQKPNLQQEEIYNPRSLSLGKEGTSRRKKILEALAQAKATNTTPITFFLGSCNMTKPDMKPYPIYHKVMISNLQ